MTTQTKITQEDLNKTLWQAADSSRSQVDAGVYKDYVLSMLFFKYLSDLSKKKHAEYKVRFGDDENRCDGFHKVPFLQLEAVEINRQRRPGGVGHAV